MADLYGQLAAHHPVWDNASNRRGRERGIELVRTMWDDDRLTGIIGWECAGLGHPGIDLGMQRCDAALVVGLSGAEAVLAGYESAIGDPPPMSPTGTSPPP